MNRKNITEDVINNNEADKGAVITDNEEDLSAEDTIENEEIDNNDESEEISPDTNIETIADDEAQRSDGKINRESIRDKDEAQRSASTVDENPLLEGRE